MNPRIEQDSLPTFAVILAAAGKSRRFSGENDEGPVAKKPFVLLGDKPVWLYSAEKFARRDDVRQILVVVSPEDLDWFRHYYTDSIDRFLIQVVAGGAERSDSVRNALALISEEIEFVAVHDAARPCVSESLIDAVFQKARQTGAALPASPITGTVKRVRDGIVEETISRDSLWEVQTPQVFRRNLLCRAYEALGKEPVTDDAQCVERIGYDVFVIPSEDWNLKITTPTDLGIAEMIISRENLFSAPPLMGKIDYDNFEGP